MREVTAILVFLTVKAGYSAPASFRNARTEDVGSNGADSYGGPIQQEGAASGPYPPSGWTPSGDLFLLPGETHSSQQEGFRPPPPPSNQYGPTNLSTERTTTTTTEANQEPEASEGDPQNGEPISENGQYYVLLPEGRLQRVQYSGKQRGRGYEAQVQYEDVDPVRAPVYSYTNLPLQIPLPF